MELQTDLTRKWQTHNICCVKMTFKQNHFGGGAD